MPVYRYNNELGVDIRNTHSMDMSPQRAEEFHAIDHGGGKIELLPVMTGEVFSEFVNYPVIVEGWDKKKYGRHSRAWKATFSQAERDTLARYYGRFYRWYLISGTLRRVSCRLSTLTLLQRAVMFFAGLS